MLVEFRVTNLFSFDEETKLSMIPSIQNKTGTIKVGDINLLKFASIYGANASGKSNLIKAMQTFKDLIFKGTKGISKNIYCRCQAENKDKESIIECIYSTGSRFYAFGIKFIVNTGVFVEEWIESISPKTEKTKTIFRYSHNLSNINAVFPCVSKDNPDFHRLETYVFDQTQNDIYNTLLITSLLDKKFEDPNTFFISDFKKWLESFDVYYADEPIGMFKYFDNKGNYSKVEKILGEFNTGITKISFVEITTEELVERTDKELVKEIKSNLEKIASSKKKANERTGVLLRNSSSYFRIRLGEDGNLISEALCLNHSGIGCKFNLDEESDGTIRLFDLLDIALTGKEDMVYVVDEIDRSLHPVLLYKFIEMVKNEFVDRNIQIIFTTHETHIMDLNLFRRDEIWFVEKNNRGASNIFSLDIFKERNNKIISAGYIKGIYGGIPLFKKIED